MIEPKKTYVALDFQIENTYKMESGGEEKEVISTKIIIPFHDYVKIGEVVTTEIDTQHIVLDGKKYLRVE